MKARYYWKAIARTVFFSGSVAFTFMAEGNEKSLCRPDEDLYFSCIIKGKVLSICASENSWPDNGYVQYRFGEIGKIEFEYPKKLAPPSGIFSISDISGGNLNITHIKFNYRGYHYVVYQGNNNGVYIVKNGKTVSNQMCDFSTGLQINPRAFRGIETVDSVDDIDG